MRPPGTDGPSFLHRASPALKLGLAFSLLVFIVLLPRYLTPLYVAPAILLLLVWAISRMPWRQTLRKLLVAEFFILGVALLPLVNPGSRPVVFSAIAKSNLCVLTMLVLIWTTPFHNLLGTLRKLGMPAIMITTLALMSRYLPVLAEESRRMQRARASRTFVAHRKLQWVSLTEIIAHLFLRSADRAERIYLAMCSRGWK